MAIDSWECARELSMILKAAAEDVDNLALIHGAAEKARLVNCKVSVLADRVAGHKKPKCDLS